VFGCGICARRPCCGRKWSGPCQAASLPDQFGVHELELPFTITSPLLRLSWIYFWSSNKNTPALGLGKQLHGLERLPPGSGLRSLYCLPNDCSVLPQLSYHLPNFTDKASYITSLSIPLFFFFFPSCSSIPPLLIYCTPRTSIAKL
jgi:hypothetical protein